MCVSNQWKHYTLFNRQRFLSRTRQSPPPSLFPLSLHIICFVVNRYWVCGSRCNNPTVYMTNGHGEKSMQSLQPIVKGLQCAFFFFMLKLKKTKVSVTHRPKLRFLWYAVISQIYLVLFLSHLWCFLLCQIRLQWCKKIYSWDFSSSFLRESIYSWPVSAVSNRHGDMLGCLHCRRAVSVVPSHSQSGHERLWSSSGLQVLLLHYFFSQISIM